MSGHSKWAKVHRQKTITDAKKGAVFTKLGNLITVAAKEGGEDIETNFKLRLAVEKARQANMPKDNIDRAIKKGAGLSTGKTALAEITYEAFGPSGSVFVIEAITDNKNRTVADLKAVLNKNGGQLGGPNSTLWQFERKGLILSENYEDYIVHQTEKPIFKHENLDWDEIKEYYYKAFREYYLNVNYIFRRFKRSLFMGDLFYDLKYFLASKW